ncbi:MAG: PocR ligand-binding domain-containing protein [bacterium]|nr:PocR ligand-binding domain-containing protein [bacterium]MDD3805893.1 PocR ligand-binding domain-containing protein [bacterium]MDD4558332.1 PocR ligand-binding domain-containing protein [bacterium]
MFPYCFSDLVDSERLKELLESFSVIAGVAVAIFDPDDKTLIAAGWQEICTRFHRASPLTAVRCQESDARIKKKSHTDIGTGYRCPNGLFDYACPIIIEGAHLATLFIGQFFLEPPDEGFFRQQARDFGFNEQEYIRALHKVPVLSEDSITTVLRFITGLSSILVHMGLERLRNLKVAEEAIVTEKALQKSRERYRAFVESTVDMVFLKDENFRYTMVNKSLADFFGRSEEEILGSKDHDFMPADVAETYRKSDLRAIRAGCVVVEEGTIGNRFFEARKYPVILDNGYTGVGGYIRDVTEKRQLEEQMLQTSKLESLGKLAGGVAHEFNNLLTGIIGYTQLIMQSRTADDPVLADLNQVLQLSNRATELTGQLLAFGRGQAVLPRIIDINDVVDKTLKMIKHLIGEDITLKFKPDPDLRSVKIDPGQIEQVLMNLALNSRDAMPEGGILSMETMNVILDQEFVARHAGSREGEYVMLAVTDNGSGMNRETMEHIFDPFFTTKEVGHGTGLGLAMVYGIVKQHNGCIYADSVPGEGTLFRIYLPQADQDAEVIETSIVKVESLTGNETILLVEDEEQLRVLIERILKEMGYNVYVAICPSEAESLFVKYAGRIDLLLTDMIMPECDGRTLYNRLLEKMASLKALFMSGYVATIPSGIGDNYIRKPFMPDELYCKVRNVLDGRRQV